MPGADRAWRPPLFPGYLRMFDLLAYSLWRLAYSGTTQSPIIHSGPTHVKKRILVRASPRSIAERAVDHPLDDLRPERAWIRICRPGGHERDRFAREFESDGRGHAVGVAASHHTCVRPGRPPCDPPGDAISIPKLQVRHAPPRFNSCAIRSVAGIRLSRVSYAHAGPPGPPRSHVSRESWTPRHPCVLERKRPGAASRLPGAVPRQGLEPRTY